MVDITRHPRQVIIPEWSVKSWAHNVFRTYEYLFGRRNGVKKEMSTLFYKGTTIYYCHSWESVFALLESNIRALFKWKLPVFVSIPVLMTTTGLPVSPYLFAIATDATSSQANPATGWTQICTGSNLKLMVSFSTNVAGTDNVTALAYNAVSATTVGFVQKPSDRGQDLWYLDNPSTGSHSIVPTATGFYAGLASSYTGCGTGIDSFNTGTVPLGSATSLTVSTTVVAANCWLVGMMGDDSTAVSGGTGTVVRIADTGNASAFVDSNGTVGTGSQSLQVTWSGSHGAAGVIASIKPFVTVTVNSGFFFATSR